MKTKAPPPPLKYSERCALLERAIHAATEAHRHLMIVCESVSGLAPPVRNCARDAKRLAEVTQNLKVELEKQLAMYVDLEDDCQLLDPDEGFEPEYNFSDEPPTQPTLFE